jgi:hypothetical protein
VAGASVATATSGRAANQLTDEGGRFTVVVSAGDTARIVVRAVGFAPDSLFVAIGARDTSIAIPLRRVATALAADTVRGRGRQDNGFADRRATGKGIFLDRAALEKKNAATVVDLLRSMPGVQVRPRGFGAEYEVRFDRCTNPVVFLDGQEFRGFRPSEALRLVNTASLVAVEVYSSPSRLPPQFRTMDSCAAIVLWTR